MTRERVLLTGASGLLGSHALDFLLDNTDWQIVCPVSFRHRGVCERINTILEAARSSDRARVEVIHTDLASPVNFTTEYLFGDITHIINFASATDIMTSIADPVTHIKNNVDVMLYLLEYARTLDNLEAFVHVSTNEIYEANPLGKIREWDTLMPSSPYSASKVAQESMAISYWRTFAIPVMFVNTMNVFGEMQDPVKYIPQLVRQISHGEVVKIYCDESMTAPMTQVFIHAREIASAILFLLRRSVPMMIENAPSAAQPRPDRWHVAGAHEHDGIVTAQLVANIMDKELKYELVPMTSRGRYVLDNHKITQLGWSQLRSFHTSLERVVKWSLQHPMWLGESRAA